jgi:hypothetical protein
MAPVRRRSDGGIPVRRGQDSNLRGPKPDRWSPLGRFGYLSLLTPCLDVISVWLDHSIPTAPVL